MSYFTRKWGAKLRPKKWKFKVHVFHKVGNSWRILHTRAKMVYRDDGTTEFITVRYGKIPTPPNEARYGNEFFVAEPAEGQVVPLKPRPEKSRKLGDVEHD